MKTSEDLSDAFGYLTLDEVAFLKDCVAASPTQGVLVNIGAGVGTSGLAMAEIRPDQERYTVDISKGSPLGGFKNEDNAFEGTGLPCPIHLLGNSHKVGVDWQESPEKQEISLLFIDGGHSEEEIRGDIEIWLPSVMEGGVIVFHDYDSVHWAAVKNTVDELMSGHKRIGLVHTTIAFWNK